MNVVFANEYFLPHAPGGAEWSVFHLAKALAARGHAVRVVTPDLSRPGERERVRNVDAELSAAGNAHVRRFPWPVKMRANGGALPPYVFGNPIFRRRMSVEIIRTARREGAHVIHAHGYDCFSPVLVASSWTGLPAVATVRDYRALCPVSICLHEEDRAPTPCDYRKFRECSARYLEEYGLHFSLGKRLRYEARRILEWRNHRHASESMQQLDGAVFVSRRIRDIYSDAGLAPANSAVIPNLPPASLIPSDPQAFSRKWGLDGKRVLAFVGRYSLGKGAAVLSRSMPEILRRHPDAVCVVAGRKEADVAAEGMIFTGPLDAGEVQALYRLAEAVLLPSRWQEPLSRVLIEAMQNGVPVVATDSGGNGEVVRDGENGRLVPRNDPAVFAGAVNEFLYMEESGRVRMSQAAAATISEHFNSDDLVRRVEEFYASVIEDRKALK